MIKKPSEYKAPDTNERDRLVEETLSRRRFLNTASCAAVGGLAAAVGGSILLEKKANATTPPEAPSLPWKYSKLDPLEAGKRGYKNYLLRGG